MRFDFILENEKGEQINFTKSSNYYMISSIDGLSEPPATISSSRYACIDGCYINNAAIEKRNIVVNFSMTGTGIESRRQRLYSIVKTRKYIKAIYKTQNTDVFTEGVVETCTISNFEREITGQISIICSDPFWYSTSKADYTLDTLQGGFVFPFSIEEPGIPFSWYDTAAILTIENEGEETGFLIEMTFSGDCSQPTIYNIQTAEILKLSGGWLRDNTIKIDTRETHKKIELLSGGRTRNVTSAFTSGSTWLTLRPGINQFRVYASSGAEHIHLKITKQNKFLGV